MRYIRESISRISAAIEQARKDSEPPLHRDLTQKELEAEVIKALDKLGTGIDTPSARLVLAALEEKGITPIKEVCMNCGTKIITSWGARRYRPNYQGEVVPSHIEIISVMAVIPVVCPVDKDGRHTVTGM